MDESDYKKIIAIGGICLTVALGGLYLQNKKISHLEKGIYSMEKELAPNYELRNGFYREFYVIHGDTLVELSQYLDYYRSLNLLDASK